MLCDIVVLYVVKKGPFYREKKYLYVKGDDAFNVSTEPGHVIQTNCKKKLY